MDSNTCCKRLGPYLANGPQAEDPLGPDQKLRPYNASTAKTPYNGRTHYAPGPKEANQGPKPRPMPDLKLKAYNAPDQQRRAIWALPLGP